MQSKGRGRNASVYMELRARRQEEEEKLLFEIDDALIIMSYKWTDVKIICLLKNLTKQENT